MKIYLVWEDMCSDDRNVELIESDKEKAIEFAKTLNAGYVEECELGIPNSFVDIWDYEMKT